MGVIVGGLLSAGTAYFFEQLRRRRQRRDKLDDERREALRWALAWIDPMESALSRGEIEIYALFNGASDEQEFRKNYPNLFSTLTKLDLSPDQRLVLAADVYPMGNNLWRAVENLKYEAIELWEKTRYPVDSPQLSVVNARYECTVRIRQLQHQVEALQRRLAAEYRKTYD